MFSNVSRRQVVALLIISSLLMLTIDRDGNPVVDRVRSVAVRVMSPFESAASAVARPLTNAWEAITEHDELVAENERLRDDAERQRGTEINSRWAILLAQDLLSQYELDEEFSVVKVRVVGLAASNLQNTIEINKGANDGIRIGMPVISQGGVVGKITRVYEDRAVVMLIIDPNYSIGAEVLAVDGGTATTTTTSPGDPQSTSPSGNVPGESTTTTSTTTTTTTTAPTGATDPPDGETDSPVTTAVPALTTTTTLPVVRRETGILAGQGAGQPLILEFADDVVQVGDVVVTSGGSGVNSSLAPQGLNLGVVSRIIAKPGSNSVLVEVTPAADVRRLNFLDVVLYAPPTGGG